MLVDCASLDPWCAGYSLISMGFASGRQWRLRTVLGFITESCSLRSIPVRDRLSLIPSGLMTTRMPTSGSKFSSDLISAGSISMCWSKARPRYPKNTQLMISCVQMANHLSMFLNSGKTHVCIDRKSEWTCKVRATFNWYSPFLNFTFYYKTICFFFIVIIKTIITKKLPK